MPNWTNFKCLRTALKSTNKTAHAKKLCFNRNTVLTSMSCSHNDGRNKENKKIIKINEWFPFLLYPSKQKKSTHFFCVSNELNYSLKQLWKFERTWKSLWFVFPAACSSCSHSFSCVLNFHSCFYDSKETEKMFSITQRHYYTHYCILSWKWFT